MKFWIADPTLVRFVVIATFLGMLTPLAQAQSSRVEVFALGGVGRVNGDEGSLGTGWSASGVVTIPFTPRWAMEIDGTHLDSERDVGPVVFTARHTHISPALQYRRGSDRTYGFVAAGAGLSVACEGSNFVVTQRCDSFTDFHWMLRGGLVRAVSTRWLIRVEAFSFFQYVAPDIGVRGGVGYRF